MLYIIYIMKETWMKIRHAAAMSRYRTRQDRTGQEQATYKCEAQKGGGIPLQSNQSQRPAP
jgi:hypothetical protein